MKNRLHGKKAGIAILVSLILISVAEIIYRAFVAGDRIYTTANLGEQFVVLGLYVDRHNTNAQKVYQKLGMEECNYLMYEN